MKLYFTSIATFIFFEEKIFQFQRRFAINEYPLIIDVYEGCG